MKKIILLLFLVVSSIQLKAQDDARIVSPLEQAQAKVYDLYYQEMGLLSQILEQHKNKWGFVNQFLKDPFVKQYFSWLMEKAYQDISSDETVSLDNIIENILHSPNTCEQRKKLHETLGTLWDNYSAKHNYPDEWMLTYYDVNPLVFVVQVFDQEVILSEKTILIEKIMEKIDNETQMLKGKAWKMRT